MNICLPMVFPGPVLENPHGENYYDVEFDRSALQQLVNPAIRIELSPPDRDLKIQQELELIAAATGDISAHFEGRGRGSGRRNYKCDP